MTYKDIIKDIKNKNYAPIYVLMGDEPFYIDGIVNYIEENVLTEAEKAFNFTVLYGKDTDHLQLVDVARRYPMMASHQVVILKEAQAMRTIANLESYVQNPMPTTILVIAHKYKKLDKRTKFYKALSKHALIFESKKLYENKVGGWIQNYLKDKKREIDAPSLALMVEYLGNDLSKISNELDKMCLNVPAGTTINADHIHKNIGISKDYNVFELQNALGSKNALKTQRIVNYFIANPKSNPFVMVVATLYNYFSKIYMGHFCKNLGDREFAQKIGLRSAYFVKDYKTGMKYYPLKKTEKIISLLREYDLKSKGVNSSSTPPGELLRELVFKILH